MPKTRTRLTGPMSQRLRTARVQAGLTQQEVADAIPMSLKSVNNYENSDYHGARKAVVVRPWAELCGRRFEEIWGPPRQPIVRSGWLSAA